jgi:NADH-quinone oxidoreductase subunit L
LRGAMRVTFLTYAIGMMALSGVPLFFAGAWTKEEILHAASHWHGGRAPYYLMMLGVILTALYMTRQMIYIFFGSRRSAAAHAHESPRVMTLPLIVLAVCTVGLSLVLTPAWPWLHEYLNGASAHTNFGALFTPMLLISFVLVAVGIGVGVLVYRNAAERDPLAAAQPALFRFLANRMWLDELYSHTVVAFSRTAARLSDWLDRYLWDGLVRGLGVVGQLLGTFTRGVDERGINAGVDESTSGARGFGRVIAAAHSGQIQGYLAAVGLAMLGLLLLYAWLG